MYPTYWTCRRSNETSRPYLAGINRISPCQPKFVYTPHACWQFSSMAQKPGPLHKQIGNDRTRCQRRILHTRWYDFVSNNEVLRRIGLLAASSIVRKRRLGLFGHVARLTEDVPANQILRTCCEAQDSARPSPD